MSYKKSLLERKQAFLEDACATCGGGGSEDGGSAPEYEPGADDELALGKALKKLKSKKKRETPVSDNTLPEGVLPLMLKREEKEDDIPKKQDTVINKKQVLEAALRLRKEMK